MKWHDWLTALLPDFINLVTKLAGDEYDEEAEKQAILEFNTKVADARAKRELRQG